MGCCFSYITNKNVILGNSIRCVNCDNLMKQLIINISSNELFCNYHCWEKKLRRCSIRY